MVTPPLPLVVFLAQVDLTVKGWYVGGVRESFCWLFCSVRPRLDSALIDR